MRENSLSIKLEKISKRFLSEWIFRNISLEIIPRQKIAVLGQNGSGKSTFLQSVASYQTLTSGSVEYYLNNKSVDASFHYKHLSIATPYMELIEDMTFIESIEHQKIFKPFLPELSIPEIIEISGLEKKNARKQIRLYSSGMKQRAKLTLAILTDAPLLLLDEPCSNLDSYAIEWYQEMIKNFASNKTIIVCSNNITSEFKFCTSQLNIQDYKK